VGLIAGGDAALRKSSESREDDPHGAVAELLRLHLEPRDTVIGIAAGGTTAYVLGALEYARSRDTTTAIISCSPVEIDVDHTIFLDTGPEILTGSTRMKAGTATKLVLNTISTTVMVQTGRVYQNLMVDVKATNDKLRDRAARIVSALTGLDRSNAFTLLSRANGEVKTAVVMHRLSIDRESAEQRLADASGRLDAVLED
ncbi:MAG: N-acetylmuramic acid 6-phosphate etherase, partial [Phycisphaerales bacterium]|nr:N-acetylmuramic acid 6-phosphate etherase [Phycisphaerales bacterium]